jgi:hypothetical protein
MVRVRLAFVFICASDVTAVEQLRKQRTRDYTQLNSTHKQRKLHSNDVRGGIVQGRS